MYAVQLIKNSSVIATKCSAVIFITGDAFGECGRLSVSLKPCEGTMGLFTLRVLISWQHTRECSLGNSGLACHWWPPVDKHSSTSDVEPYAAAPCWGSTNIQQYMSRQQKTCLIEGIWIFLCMLFIYMPLKRHVYVKMTFNIELHCNVWIFKVHKISLLPFKYSSIHK